MSVHPALSPFVAAGVLLPGDAAVATRLGALVGNEAPEPVLATALCLQALRAGSVCIDVTTVAQQGFERDEETVASQALPWPDPDAWLASLQTSPLVSRGPEAAQVRPLRLVDGRLYLERYWGHEEAVRRHLIDRLTPAADQPAVPNDILERRFPGRGLAPGEPDLQRAAASHALTHRLTIIAGGPGTGKTSTVAGLLAAAWDAAGSAGTGAPRIALAAPTGKAAARLEESLRAELARQTDAPLALTRLGASTIHRLLGWLPGSASRFQHDAANPLPYDLVVIDEASMVSLALMRRLLDALRPAARLVLVGDPDQLSPVEAGAVLADVVHAPAFAAATVELTHNWRFGTQIAALAAAIRRGDAAATLDLLRADGDAVEFIPVDAARAGAADLEPLRRAVVESGTLLRAAAREGDASAALRHLDAHRLLCAHRRGPWGIQRWAWQAERWLGGPGFVGSDEWYAGRPILINQNLRDVQLYNGDSGVVVRTAAGPRAAFDRGGGVAWFSPGQLSDVTTLLAMTVHKSQGSQFGHVSLVLPGPESPLLTRELLYTAVTRARRRVSVFGTPDAVAAAVDRPAVRASGLRTRL